MEKIKVMIVGDNDNKIFEIKNLLVSEETAFVGYARYGASAVEKVLSIKPNAVILQCESQYDEAIEIAEKMYTTMPGCCILMVSAKLEGDTIEKVMHVGVRRMLSLPIEPDALTNAILSAYQLEKTRLQNTNTSTANMQSRVITVFGAKGGIGKTTLAANLGVMLSQMGKKVAIIDADLQFGDANVFFDLDSKDTIAELVQEKSATDIDVIKRFTMLHFSGVSLLCAPKSPEYAEYVTAKNIISIINTMRPYYDYVIVDTAPFFHDVTIAALESANLILMVSGLDISTLRNTKISMGVLESLQQQEKVQIVVNKITDGIISVKDMQRILDTKVSNTISFDMKTALTCHNKGVPIVIEYPRTKIAQELYKLKQNIVAAIDNSIN